MKEKDKKSGLILLLTALLAFMAVCYSILFQRLSIIGTVKVDPRWNIKITEVTLEEGGNAVNKNMQYTDNSVSLSADLKVPGDYVDYIIKVENKGNINAKLSEYIMPYVSSDNKKYMTLSLELIVADKLMLNRDKDREDIEKIKECNGISEERIKKIPLPIVKKVKLVGDNLEFTTTMPRIKLDIPKRQKSMGFINIGTILLLIAVVVCFILGNR